MTKATLKRKHIIRGIWFLSVLETMVILESCMATGRQAGRQESDVAAE